MNKLNNNPVTKKIPLYMNLQREMKNT